MTRSLSRLAALRAVTPSRSHKLLLVTIYRVQNSQSLQTSLHSTFSIFPFRQNSSCIVKLIQFKVESRLASDMVKYSKLTRRYQYNIYLRKILCAGFGRGFLPPPHHKVQAQTLYKQSNLLVRKLKGLHQNLTISNFSASLIIKDKTETLSLSFSQQIDFHFTVNNSQGCERDAGFP